jgi:hypothetical protein
MMLAEVAIAHARSADETHNGARRWLMEAYMGGAAVLSRAIEIRALLAHETSAAGGRFNSSAGPPGDCRGRKT